ncbi:PD-(D/E)XK nuclease family protein [Sphingobium sp. EP60837]|uniref:PD-(D/E)XK nuclease family protein n=1 Tax=Sphingobium sp. EP60837 TaxID=1855519 RepID=UPI0007DDE312|nr:PD-(D/E)XK nuclease family protein [Sphingobium sp. EP60837]ANI79030.1 hypothetical protein EP837_02635 [Sphingobium sp. EP60837]
MTAIPEPNHSIAALIDEAHAQAKSKPRPHFGLSMVGHHCERFLWLNFRWAVIEQHEGRILRLFRRGHREEETILADLVRIGVKVVTTQAKVDFGSHVSGSVDGVLENVPGGGKVRHLAEFKTHSKKSFDQLAKDGLQKAKPMHWAQMQTYMLGLGLERGLYVAVCKDDDRLHTERVKLDSEAAKALVERARRIATSDRLPPPISTDPTWYQCRFCPAYAFCHQSEPTRQVNCRTCALSTARPDSTWQCERWKDAIPDDHQHGGCWGHVLHPDLVPWEMVRGTDGSATYLIDGKEYVNGDDGHDSGDLLTLCSLGQSDIGKAIARHFPSAELLANAS